MSLVVRDKGDGKSFQAVANPGNDHKDALLDPKAAVVAAVGKESLETWKLRDGEPRRKDLKIDLNKAPIYKLKAPLLRHICALAGCPGITLRVSPEFLDATYLARYGQEFSVRPQSDSPQRHPLDFPLLPSPQLYWSDRLKECNQRFHPKWEQFKQTAAPELKSRVIDEGKAGRTTSFHLELEPNSLVNQVNRVQILFNMCGGANLTVGDSGSGIRVNTLKRHHYEPAKGITSHHIDRLKGNVKMVIPSGEKREFPKYGSSVQFTHVDIPGDVEIPPEIGQYSITELRIGFEKNSPKEIWDVKGMEMLSLRYSAGEKGELKALQVSFPTEPLLKLKELKLSNVSIADLNLEMFPNLTSLILEFSYTNFTDFPAGISKHSKLETLELKENIYRERSTLLVGKKLTTLPRGFPRGLKELKQNFPALRNLSLSLPNLKALPFSFLEADHRVLSMDVNHCGFLGAFKFNEKNDYLPKDNYTAIPPSGYRSLDGYDWQLQLDFAKFVRTKKKEWDGKVCDEKECSRKDTTIFQRLQPWFLADDTE